MITRPWVILHPAARQLLPVPVPRILPCSPSVLIHLAEASLTPLPSPVSLCFLPCFIYPRGLAFVLIMRF